MYELPGWKAHCTAANVSKIRNCLCDSFGALVRRRKQSNRAGEPTGLKGAIAPHSTLEYIQHLRYDYAYGMVVSLGLVFRTVE